MFINLENANKFLNTYRSVISMRQFNLIEGVTLGIQQIVSFTDEEITELDRKLSARIAYDNEIRTVAENNNKGIEFERTGEIDKAVQVYEENIAAGYPATHSYDRLMIIYKRQKKYKDEIRVIKKAIEVFDKENERRFEKAFYNTTDTSIREKIKEGFHNNRRVKGASGYLFVPYDVTNWNERLQKEIKK